MRTYKQYCGLAKALDIIGERWTLLILRELVPGGRRYGDLHRSLGGITTNLLAKRLKHLESHGVVVKRLLPPPASVTVYELTDRGRELEPALLALGRFGGHWLARREQHVRVDVRWLMVSLQRRYRGGLAPLTLQLWVGDSPYVLRIRGDDLTVRDGVVDVADVSVRGAESAVVALLGAGRRASDLALDIRGPISRVSELQDALLGPSGERALIAPIA